MEKWGDLGEGQEGGETGTGARVGAGMQACSPADVQAQIWDTLPGTVPTFGFFASCDGHTQVPFSLCPTAGSCAPPPRQETTVLTAQGPGTPRHVRVTRSEPVS